LRGEHVGRCSLLTVRGRTRHQARQQARQRCCRARVLGEVSTADAPGVAPREARRGTCAWVSHANGTSRRGSASCAAIDKSARGRARGAISAHRHASMPRRQGRTARGPTAAITRRNTRGRGDGGDERRWLVSTSRRARVGYRLLRGDADHDRRVVGIADVDCGRAGGAPARATAAESELSKGRTRHASVAAAPASFRARPVVTC